MTRTQDLNKAYLAKISVTPRCTIPSILPLFTLFFILKLRQVDSLVNLLNNGMIYFEFTYLSVVVCSHTNILNVSQNVLFSVGTFLSFNFL